MFKFILTLIVLSFILSNCATTINGSQYDEKLKKEMNKENHPKGNLGIIINAFGYPSFYDYFENDNILIIYYLSEDATAFYFLLPFFILKKIDYHNYYFQFKVNRSNVLESELENTGYKIMLGKHYEYDQIPFGIFLSTIK